MLVLYHDFHNKEQKKSREDFRSNFNTCDCKYDITIYARTF